MYAYKYHFVLQLGDQLATVFYSEYFLIHAQHGTLVEPPMTDPCQLDSQLKHQTFMCCFESETIK